MKLKEDKSEGVNNGVFSVADPPLLPVNERFIIYRDEEGDFVVEAQRIQMNQHLSAHGPSPDDAVWAMRETLAMVASMSKNRGDESPEKISLCESDGWVSVKDRLPPHGHDDDPKFCQVIWKKNWRGCRLKPDDEKDLSIASLSGVGVCFIPYLFDQLEGKWTHWRPLPSLPVPKSEKERTK